MPNNIHHIVLRISLLYLLTLQFSCTLNDEEATPLLTSVSDTVSTPVILSFNGSAIDKKINDLRRSDGINVLVSLNELLKATMVDSQNYYLQFLERRLTLMESFQLEELNVTDFNNAIKQTIHLDSLVAEANQDLLNISFDPNNGFELLEASKPLEVEFSSQISGEEVTIVFVIDTVRFGTTEDGQRFYQYNEKLLVNDREFYNYDLNSEYAEEGAIYILQQDYQLGELFISFRSEVNDDKAISGYSISEESKVLINSRISLNKENGSFTNGLLNVVIENIEIEGELSNTSSIVSDIREALKDRLSLTETSSELQSAFDGRSRLIAINKTNDTYIADVDIESKVIGTTVATGYTFLFPTSEVLFLPDFMKTTLNQIHEDFIFFNISLF